MATTTLLLFDSSLNALFICIMISVSPLFTVAHFGVFLINPCQSEKTITTRKNFILYHGKLLELKLIFRHIPETKYKALLTFL